MIDNDQYSTFTLLYGIYNGFSKCILPEYIRVALEGKGISVYKHGI